MSDLSDLKVIKSQLIARLKEVTAKRKPSYDIDGQDVSWTEYTRMLREQINETRILIGEETRQYIGNAFDVVDLGDRPIRGKSHEIRIYRVLGKSPES